MKIDITLPNEMGGMVPSEEMLKNPVRPENSYEPPSGEEILKTWEPENIQFQFHDEDNLPYMTFTKDGMHAILHRPLDGIEYHAAMVYHESQGFIYICDCYSDADAVRISFIGGLIAFSPFLLEKAGTA
jgi:hypothetical protein